MKPLLHNAENVVKKAFDVGVERIITVGIDLDDSKTAVNLASKFANVYATAGVHPHDCESYIDSDCKAFLELVENKKVLAIGEIGLDFYRDIAPRPTQEKVFSSMLSLSLEAKKPVVIHCRDAGKRCRDILDEHLGGGASLGGILHCFNGDKLMMDWALDNGFYLSFAGSVTYKNAVIIQDALKIAPKDRILIETDCPYLSPEPMRGKTNEPANLIYTADFLAYLIGVEMHELSHILEENFRRLFGVFPEN